MIAVNYYFRYIYSHGYCSLFLQMLVYECLFGKENFGFSQVDIKMKRLVNALYVAVFSSSSDEKEMYLWILRERSLYQHLQDSLYLK